MNINLIKYNRHWEENFLYNYKKKRTVFNNIIKTFDRKHIFELMGLRRTGKTTLFFQSIDYLIENKKIPRRSVWYFTFDEYNNISLEDLFSLFVQHTGVEFGKEKVYIFLDEIQKLDNFQNQLKVLYDLYPEIKFCISGSTSLFVKKKTQESLAGRLISEILHPLDFTEYLIFKEKEYIIDNPLMHEVEMKREFETFLRSQFIESVFMEEEDTRREYFVSIMRKVVFEDIPQIFNINNPEILWRITKVIASNPGLLFDYNEMAKELGVGRSTVSSYVFYLEEAFLLKKLYNFSRNLITSEKKLKKMYLISPSFSWALTDYMETNKLAENFIASLSDYKFFWRDAYKHEIDFIKIEGDKVLPIEVKYKEAIKERELKNFAIFYNKFKAHNGIILCKTLEDKNIKLNDTNIFIKSIYFPELSCVSP